MVNIMKRFIILVILCCVLVILPFSFACQKNSYLLSKVSELRSDILVGEAEGYSLKAHYGYKEQPYANDASVGKCINRLTFFLTGEKIKESKFSLILVANGEKVNIDFEVDRLGRQTASVECENFNDKQLPCTLRCGGESVEFNLQSILPQNTVDINTALLSLEKDQKAFIESYTVDLDFKAEIYARVLVKNEKPYWYVAFANGKSLKAFLIDGLNCEVLAIREVF